MSSLRASYNDYSYCMIPLNAMPKFTFLARLTFLRVIIKFEYGYVHNEVDSTQARIVQHTTFFIYCRKALLLIEMLEGKDACQYWHGTENN